MKMVFVSKIIAVAGVFMISGCVTPPGTKINPTRMHVADTSAYWFSKKPSDYSIDKNDVEGAEKLPAARYFSNMKAAKDNDTLENRKAYVLSGIVLTKAYCLRWFQRLSDQSMVKNYADGNMNVIRQLGTALLGIGNASSPIVATYGASNTAWEGLSKNFEDSFLVAPSSNKVKLQIMNMLDVEARKIMKETPMSFDEAYIVMERFAELCTHSSAREVVNAAIDQGQAKFQDGKVRIEPDNYRVNDAVKNEIDSLKSEKEILIGEREFANASLTQANIRVRTLEQKLNELKNKSENLNNPSISGDLNKKAPEEGQGNSVVDRKM